MIKYLFTKFLSSLHYIIFNYIGSSFRADTLKRLMDLLFVIFEKTAHRFDIIVSFYFKLYQEMIEKEIKMSKILSEDLVLVIGCGSLPVTSMYIAKKTGANIVSIDKDKKAINKSMSVVDNLSYKNRIKFFNADGSTYPVDRFNVIFVSYGVKYENDVLNHLSTNINPNARVVFRTTLDYIQNKHNKIKLSNLFDIKNHVHSESFGRIVSFLLCKKKNNH